MKIEEMSLENRPRERLIKKGVNSLSDDELIAIILKTGTRAKPVKSLAADVLKEVGRMDNFKNLKPEYLYKLKGIGEAKASYLLAAIEFGRRVYYSNSEIKGEVFNSPEVIFNYYYELLRSKDQECFYAVYLDVNKRIISDKLLFVGTVNRSMVHPRDIFKEAYKVDACYVVCVHNHPSGEVKPSKADIETTKLIKSVGEIMGIYLLDHIIIGDGYYSFFNNDII